MADDVVGSCCSVLFIACLDVCNGICGDIIATRQSCPQQCASCCDSLFCCGRSESKEPDNSNYDESFEPNETQPLLQNVQPATQPGMMHPHPGIQVVPAAVLPSPPPTPDGRGLAVGNAAVGQVETMR